MENALDLFESLSYIQENKEYCIFRFARVAKFKKENADLLLSGKMSPF